MPVTKNLFSDKVLRQIALQEIEESHWGGSLPRVIWTKTGEKPRMGKTTTRRGTTVQAVYIPESWARALIEDTFSKVLERATWEE